MIATPCSASALEIAVKWGLSINDSMAMVRRGTPSWNDFLGDWNYLRYD
jgi:hypothetical protein